MSSLYQIYPPTLYPVQHQNVLQELSSSHSVKSGNRISCYLDSFHFLYDILMPNGEKDQDRSNPLLNHDFLEHPSAEGNVFTDMSRVSRTLSLEKGEAEMANTYSSSVIPLRNIHAAEAENHGETRSRDIKVKNISWN